MNRVTRELVWQRADHRCEYCHLWQEHTEIGHHVEHIVSRQHGGTDDPGNLALCCARCNFSKGPNLSGLDPETRQLAALFHPRVDNWAEHFEWAGPRIVGRTPTGRVTVEVLAMNEGRRVKLRSVLMAEVVRFES